MVTISQFVENCVDETRDPNRGFVFNVFMAKILLLPGFIETLFYVIHYQYLTLTPTFETAFVGERQD